MSEKRYVCQDCQRTYKTLTWFNKHIQNYRHNAVPIDLLDIEAIEKKIIEKLEEKLEARIKKIELDANFMKTRMKNITITKTQTQIEYKEEPIEKIKKEEPPKIVDPMLKYQQAYQQAFQACILDLKEILQNKDYNLKKPQDYAPEVDEKKALAKLREINAKNKRRQLDGAKMKLVRE